jgi:hypothetical protein
MSKLKIEIETELVESNRVEGNTNDIIKIL